MSESEEPNDEADGLTDAIAKTLQGSGRTVAVACAQQMADGVAHFDGDPPQVIQDTTLSALRLLGRITELGQVLDRVQAGPLVSELRIEVTRPQRVHPLTRKWHARGRAQSGRQRVPASFSAGRVQVSG